MKKYLVLFSSLVFSAAVLADDVYSYRGGGNNELEKTVSDLVLEFNNLKAGNDAVLKQVESVKQAGELLGKVPQLEKDLNTLRAAADNIKPSASRDELQALKGEVDKLRERLSELDDRAEGLRKNQETSHGDLITYAAAALGLFFFIYLITTLRGGMRSRKALREAEAVRDEHQAQMNFLADNLNAQGDSMQEIAKSISQMANSTAVQGDIIENMVIAFADRLATLETALYALDPESEGHRKLTSLVEKLHDTINATGYEMTELIGKPYIDGMDADVKFVKDPKASSEQQIITGVTKPQIKYGTKVIQRAEIIVTRNR